MKSRLVYAVMVLGLCAAAVTVVGLRLGPTLGISRDREAVPGRRFAHITTPHLAPVARQRVMEQYARMPLRFEARSEHGQGVYMARGGGYSLLVRRTEAAWAFPKSQGRQENDGRRSDFKPLRPAVGLQLAGSDNADSLGGGSPDTVVDFLGNDPKKGRTNVASYARVHCRNVYPGVDLVYYGKQGRLEYDFVIAPGADPAAQPLSFLARRDFNAGRYPRFIAVADFDGDGIPDLAVANQASNTVSVLLGNGDGNFQPAVNFAVGIRPRSITVGDFNGDGIADLAVVNEGSYPSDPGGVSVLLGNGDGTFSTAANFAAGRAPYSVAVADFNGDGALDLAIANSGFPEPAWTPGISLLLGNGDGTFHAPATLSAGSHPVFIAAGDFNGDTIPDLVVANEGRSPYTTEPGDVRLLIGKGDGTFQRAANFSAGQRPLWLAVADFNKDGRLDVATANGISSNVSVLLGDGNGAFQKAQDFDIGPATAIAAGDLNLDGIPDLAVTHGSLVSVLPGNGDGTFGAPADYGVGDLPSCIIASDFNGDGKPDLAVANAFSDHFSVLLSSGDGTFQAAPNIAIGSSRSTVATGDFNDDGNPDLVVTKADSNTVSVLLGNGDGTFGAAADFAAGTLPYAVVVADFNGDGVQDLAVSAEGSYPVGVVSVFLGAGDGTFQTAVDHAVGAGPVWVASGDFNGDGTPDLVTANERSNDVSVLLGNGDGTFQTAQAIAIRNRPIFVAVADFNGDRNLDLAVLTAGSPPPLPAVWILLGKGDGTFQPARSFDPGSTPRSVAVGDFNGDGDPDLAVVNARGVSVLLGNGDGTFQAPLSFGAGNNPFHVVVADFNGDGWLDLAVTNVNSNNVSVLAGVGDGTFLAPVHFGAGGDPRSITVADFDLDGKPDLAVTNDRTRDLSVLINNAP
jgi:hypothetical protein